MKRLLTLVVVAFEAAAVGCAASGTKPTGSQAAQADSASTRPQGGAPQNSKEQTREMILAMKDRTLADLYRLNPKSKEVIEKSEGFAVFDATDIFAVLFVGLAGRGVLIDNSTGEATYMTMARAGTGPGVGYEKFRLVIAFKNKELLNAFKTAGGDVGASGHLVVKGLGLGGSVGAEVSFDPLLSVYQITDHGLAAEASWGATAFVPDPTLNQIPRLQIPGTPYYIQKGFPGKDKESNWLPAPAGKFILMFCLYWSKEMPPSIIDGSWKPPAVTKLQ